MFYQIAEKKAFTRIFGEKVVKKCWEGGERESYHENARGEANTRMLEELRRT
jgi:hypothetical protein